MSSPRPCPSCGRPAFQKEIRKCVRCRTIGCEECLVRDMRQMLNDAREIKGKGRDPFGLMCRECRAEMELTR